MSEPKPGAAGAAAPPPGTAPIEPPPLPEGGGVEEITDLVRRFGMYFLLWVFGITVAASLVAAFWPSEIDVSTITTPEQRALAAELAEKQHVFARALQLLQVLLPAETALLGSIVGFYYGTKAQSDGPG